MAGDHEEDARDAAATGEGRASLVLVARVQGPLEAELVRGLLASYGIAVSLATQIPHSVLPLSVDGLGEVRVFVAREDEETAREVIAGHRRSGLAIVPREPAPDDDP